MPNFTEQDIKFLKAMKSQGVDAQTALTRLNKVKSGMSAPSAPSATMLAQKQKDFIPAFNPLEAVGKFAVDTAVGTGKALYSAAQGVTEGLQQLGRAGEDIAIANNLGKARENESAERIANATPYNIASNLVGGATKTLKSGVSASAAPVMGAFNAIPNETVKSTVGNVLNAPFAMQGNLIKGAGSVLGIKPEDTQKFVVEPLETAEMIYGVLNPNKVKQGAQTAARVTKQGVKNVAEKGSKLADKGSNALYETAIPLNKNEAALLQKYKAGTMKTQPNITAYTAKKYGIAGTEKRMGRKAVQVADDLYKKYLEPKIKAVKKPVRFKDLADDVKANINTLSDPSRKIDLMKALKALEADYKKAKLTKAKLETWQKIKSEKSGFLPQKAWKGEDIGAAFQEVNKLFTSAIRKKTYEMIKDKGARQRFLDYGNLKNLAELGQKAMTNQGLKGGAGSWKSTVVERALMPVLTTAGKALNEVSKRTKVLK